MKITTSEAIISASLFGSRVRNDHDSRSDLDLIVVVKDGCGRLSADEILKITQEYDVPPSISWYGAKKMKAMFGLGDLFAWHLFLESKPLGSYPSLSSIFGQPGPYQTGIKDIEALHNILCGVEAEISLRPHNLIFELGVLYVCARNIAMSATWHILPAPDFGRYSPFKLNVPFPLSMGDYSTIMACRMASQRGLPPPENATVDMGMAIQRSLVAWSLEVTNRLKIHAEPQAS